MSDPTCPARTAAAGDPLPGLAQEGCRARWVRRVAQMPKCQREEIYRATPPDELADFVADVRACFARMRGSMGGGTTYNKAGIDG